MTAANIFFMAAVFLFSPRVLFEVILSVVFNCEHSAVVTGRHQRKGV